MLADYDKKRSAEVKPLALWPLAGSFSEETIFFLTQHQVFLLVLFVPRPKEWSNNVNEPSHELRDPGNA